VTTTTVARYLIDRLAALGVRHVFGIPGDYVLGFYGELERSALTLINTADEQGAGFAADAYARMNGIGAVCVTYGVGGLKVVNTTAQAYAERSPVVVISGGPGMRERVRDPLLHHKIRSFESQLVVFREVTCAATIVADVATAQRDIDRTLAACLRHSRPVYIELPRDLVAAPLDVIDSSPEPELSDEAALDEALAETAALVAAAHQPVILAGEELARFGLQDELPSLIDRTGIPAAVTTLSKSVLDATHPLFLGVYEGAIGNESTRAYVEQSDCLLILGANLSDATLGIDTARLDPAMTISASADRPLSSIPLGRSGWPTQRQPSRSRGCSSVSTISWTATLPSSPTSVTHCSRASTSSSSRRTSCRPPTTSRSGSRCPARSASTSHDPASERSCSSATAPSR
jgi:TPP-dependent 2-oxoacid decarboxylase